jgi:hypothetical protein
MFRIPTFAGFRSLFVLKYGQSKPLLVRSTNAIWSAYKRNKTKKLRIEIGDTIFESDNQCSRRERTHIENVQALGSVISTGYAMWF